MSLFGSANYKGMVAARKKKIIASINDIEKAEQAAKKQQEKKDLALRKKQHKKLRKQLAVNFALTVKEVVRIFDAIGVFAPVMDAAGGIVEIFSGRMQERLLPSMMGVIDAILGEEMMAALDLVATGFSTILDPIIAALGTAVAAAPIGTALGVSIGGLIGSFAGNAALGAVIGGGIGIAIEAAPVGSAIGGGLGLLIGSFAGNPLIGAAIGLALGALIDSFLNDPDTGLGSAPAGRLGLPDYMYDFPGAGGAGDQARAASAAAGIAGRGDKFNADDFMNMFGGGRFQSGTPYVPESGMYHLTKGERVTSASQNSAGDGGGAISITIEGNLVGQNAMRELLEEIEYKRSIGRL